MNMYERRKGNKGFTQAERGERGPAESSVSPYIVEGTSGRGFGKVWRINARVGMFLGASAH